jgi:hypothetical protein
MNERILKLFTQACYHGDYEPENVPNAVVEKFAELIVAGAIGVLQKRFMGDLNREDMEVRRCIEDLKKHFGVEL